MFAYVKYAYLRKFSSVLSTTSAFYSKKFAIPDGIQLHCVAWNSVNDKIACGGEQGLLKVLRLEKEGSSANSALSINQRLDGHHSTVCNVSWNEKNDRLVSAEENGVIIIWSLSKGSWSEELMSENKNGTVVKISWDAAYEKMCIVYDKGYILVGTIEGKRHWSKDLKVKLFDMAWSPDSKKILVAMSNARYSVYDSDGQILTTMRLDGKTKDFTSGDIIAIHWIPNFNRGPDARCLAMDLADGVVCLLKDEADDQPLVVKTGLQSLTHLRWSHNGKTVAVGGSLNQGDLSMGNDAQNLVLFLSHTGTKLFSLSIPGSGITAFEWNSKDSKLAVCNGAYLFTAMVKGASKWCWFSNVLVYSYQTPNEFEHCLQFVNFASKETNKKRLSNVIAIASFDDICAIASKDAKTGKFVVLLCNAIGVLISSKELGIIPERVVMNREYVIVTSSVEIWSWPYREQVENAFEDVPVSINRAHVLHLEDLNNRLGVSTEARQTMQEPEYLTAFCCGVNNICIGTNTNNLLLCTFPEFNPICKHGLKACARSLSMNCDETSVAVISDNGLLSIVDFPSSKQPTSKRKTPSVKDVIPQGVWNALWSREDPNVLAVMEKAQLTIYRDLQVEERYPSTSYLCQFSNLEVETVDVDEIIRKKDRSTFELSKTLKRYKTKQLKEVEELLGASKFAEAWTIAEQSSTEVLWNMIGEAGLLHQECRNYYGIKFTRRLTEIKTSFNREALVATYLGRFDEAVEIYLRNERFSAAIELRMKIGDLVEAEQLVKEHGAEDELKQRLWNAIGEVHEDNKRWNEAVHYYSQSKNTPRLMECYFALGDIDGMKDLTRSSPQSSLLLLEIGNRMESLGVCDVAVEAFEKSGDIQRAIDCCCRLNEWEMATALAVREGYDQIGPLIQRQADRMISKNNVLGAVDLFRKTGRHVQASKMLIEIANSLKLEEVGPVLLKRIHVLSALEVDRFTGKVLRDPANITMQDTDLVTIASTGVSKTTAAQTLAGLMTLDGAAAENSDLTLDDAWHFAEAFHFFILAQKCLCQNQNEDALRVCLHLQDFEDVVSPLTIYSLLALASLRCQYFQQCALALDKLKDLPGISDAEREAYCDIKAKIFSNVSPADPRELREIRYRQTRRYTGRDFCLLSGRILRHKDKPNRCRVCRHMWCRSIDVVEECPLCRQKLSKAHV